MGDFRQLGSVGPGGGLEALVTRHPEAVHTLTDNVRQRDDAERRALEQLRAGEVSKAIRFYRRSGSLHAYPDRDDLARARWAEVGRLSGPEITLAGRPWRAGDRVVAPNRDADIVTSQRGTMAQVHPRLQALSVAWEDGRT